jgi:hypothetical protein
MFDGATIRRFPRGRILRYAVFSVSPRDILQISLSVIAEIAWEKTWESFGREVIEPAER